MVTRNKCVNPYVDVQDRQIPQTPDKQTNKQTNGQTTLIRLHLCMSLINHNGCIDRGWVGYIPMLDRWAVLSVSFLRKSATFIVDDLWNLKIL